MLDTGTKGFGTARGDWNSPLESSTMDIGKTARKMD
jgi:hypothetical protein